MFLAAIWITAPVLGLRPARAALLVIEKDPNQYPRVPYLKLISVFKLSMVVSSSWLSRFETVLNFNFRLYSFPTILKYHLKQQTGCVFLK